MHSVSWLICCLFIFSLPAHAEETRTWDKIVNLPVIGVPVITHAPETNWGFGLAVQGYFKLPDSERTSMVYGDGCYTLNKQYYISTGGTLYFGGQTPWFLLFRAGYRNFPDTYYGIGNTVTPERLKGLSYLSRRAAVRLEAQFNLPAHWSVGPLFDFIHEKIAHEEAVSGLGSGQSSNLEIPKSSNPDGSPSVMWALGAVTLYDTRDTMYYPRKGIFFKASVAHYEPALGSTARMTYLKADLRQFISLPKDIIFAWQFNTEWALSNDIAAIPFTCLPTLGGQDLVRGVRRNMFRDNALIALQAEFRFPLYKWFRLHAFAGIGDVYNTSQWNWATPKIGYGIGLRVGINPAKINIRFDIARNNIYKEWNTWESYSFYLTATEAF